MRIQLAVLSGFLGFASLGNAVSRVGGGKIQSMKSGFELSVAPLFKTADVPQETVRCLGPIGMIQQGFQVNMGIQYFEVAEFSNEFSDATNLSKQDLVARFSKSEWKEIYSSECPLTMKLKNEAVTAYFVTWGNGKGFVMKGTTTSLTEQTRSEEHTSELQSH